MTLAIDEDKLTTDTGTEIRWDEIAALHVIKLDAIERVATILEFDHIGGDLFEVNVDDDGFTDVRLRLAEHLPIPQDWYEQIEALQLGSTITLFDRREQME